MQKRSKYKVFLEKTDFPSSFPVLSMNYKQGDHDIYELHSHDCIELGYCHSGTGIFVIADEMHQFKEGDMNILPAGLPHLAQSTIGTKSDWTFIFFRPQEVFNEMLNQAEIASLCKFQCTGSPGLLSGEHFSELRIQMKSLCRELNEQQSGWQTASRGLLLSILIQLSRKFPDPKDHNSDLYERILPALNFLSHHYREPIQISELAKICFLSTPHFRRLFNQAIGCSPLTYMNRLRVEMAKQLLTESKKQIAEIALIVGFKSISSFNRQFKQHCEISPREWKKKYRRN
ncbi:MAG: AraC family transcriptional regulator [Lentisphaeria bacterium]|nr:AraC family transcriptional regulator [Lentisphaeria bacterium]